MRINLKKEDPEIKVEMTPVHFKDIRPSEDHLINHLLLPNHGDGKVFVTSTDIRRAAYIILDCPRGQPSASQQLRGQIRRVLQSFTPLALKVDTDASSLRWMSKLSAPCPVAQFGDVNVFELHAFQSVLQAIVPDHIILPYSGQTRSVGLARVQPSPIKLIEAADGNHGLAELVHKEGNSDNSALPLTSSIGVQGQSVAAQPRLYNFGTPPSDLGQAAGSHDGNGAILIRLAAAQLAEIKVKLGSREREIALLENQVKSHQSKIHALENSLGQSLQEANDKQDELRRMMDQQSVLDATRIEEMRVQIRVLEDEKQTLEARHHEAQHELTTIREQLGLEKSAHDQSKLLDSRRLRVPGYAAARMEIDAEADRYLDRQRQRRSKLADS